MTRAATEPVWREAVLWHRDGGRLVCDLCPLRCALKDGALGPCQVRRARGGRLQTCTVATSVRHWQPVERKPLFHFRPGMETLTLAAPGCTFRCDYCMNAALSQLGRDGGLPWSAAPVDPQALVATAAARGAAIALSYSEPILAAELTLGLAAAAEATGLAVPILWKSNGFATAEALALLGPCLAAANLDLKAADEATHRRLTGAPLAPVLDALALLRRFGVWLELSTPVIPGCNDDSASLTRIAAHVAALGADVPWHLVRFLPDHRRTAAAPTPPAKLAEAVAIGRRQGLRYIYVERALGDLGRRTHCPGCGAAVISRDLWRLRENRLDKGRCRDCGQVVDGRWRSSCAPSPQITGELP